MNRHVERLLTGLPILVIGGGTLGTFIIFVVNAPWLAIGIAAVCGLAYIIGWIAMKSGVEF